MLNGMRAVVVLFHFYHPHTIIAELHRLTQSRRRCGTLCLHLSHRRKTFATSDTIDLKSKHYNSPAAPITCMTMMMMMMMERCAQRKCAV